MTLGASKDNLFIPQVVADQVNTAIQGGVPVLWNGKEYTATPGLPRYPPAGAQYVPGDKITVPYWGLIDKFGKVPEGTSLKPQQVASSTEETTYERFGFYFSESNWTQVVARFANPYDQIVKAVPIAMAAALDDAIVDDFFTKVPLIKGPDGTVGAYSREIAANGTIKWEEVVTTKFLLGDEAGGLDYAFCHSKVSSDIWQLKDGVDRPLMLASTSDPDLRIGPMDGRGPAVEFKFMGSNFRVSDRRTKVANTSPQKYLMGFAKEGAGAVWYSPIEIMEMPDPSSGVRGWAFWFYAAVHTYSRLSGSRRPGAVQLKLC